MGAEGLLQAKRQGSTCAAGKERQLAPNWTNDGREWGDHKQIYMQSSLDNAGSHGNGARERRGLTSPAGRWMSETKMETEGKGGLSHNGTH